MDTDKKLSNEALSEPLQQCNVSGSTFWLCLYQYKGHETEGHLNSEEKFICEANDKVEALYKYHLWLTFRDKSRKILWSSLTEYRKSEYASGGWGFFAYKLAKGNVYRDDTEWFYVKYSEYCH